MKWLLIVVLSLAGILILIVVIGALLPQEYYVSHTITLQQPVEVVWNVITGPPNWRPDIRGYQELPPQDGHRMWRETDKNGQTITYEVIGAAPPRRLITHIADLKLPFGGTWTYELDPRESGCKLTIIERGEVYNPLFRFVSWFIMGHTATMDAYMNALQEKLKTSTP